MDSELALLLENLKKDLSKVSKDLEKVYEIDTENSELIKQRQDVINMIETLNDTYNYN